MWLVYFPYLNLMFNILISSLKIHKYSMSNFPKPVLDSDCFCCWDMHIPRQDSFGIVEHDTTLVLFTFRIVDHVEP